MGVAARVADTTLAQVGSSSITQTAWLITGGFSLQKLKLQSTEPTTRFISGQALSCGHVLNEKKEIHCSNTTQSDSMTTFGWSEYMCTEPLPYLEIDLPAVYFIISSTYTP